MLDIQDKCIELQPNEFAYNGVPLFDDVFGVFLVLIENILGKQHFFLFEFL